MAPSSFSPSFPRYLAAKKSVDDRALNTAVWQALHTRLNSIHDQFPLRVLEIGAGIGTMFERMVERGLLHHAIYTALDASPENIAAARSRLLTWAEENGLHARILPGGELHFISTGLDLTIELVARDLFDFINKAQAVQPWDLLVAHAFLDLMDIPAVLPRLFNLLRPGGYFYFTINFDGITLFEPVIDPAFDHQIETLYHQTMDERITDGKPSGDSRAGRHLFQHLPAAGGIILSAGSSDWVVYAGPDGYPADEAYFLHFIIDTVDQVLRTRPELDAARFAAWINMRHTQIERQELVYIAHQLDFMGHYPGA